MLRSRRLVIWHALFQPNYTASRPKVRNLKSHHFRTLFSESMPIMPAKHTVKYKHHLLP